MRGVRCVALVLLVLAGCRAEPRSSPLPRPTGAPAAPRSMLVQAEAWERGDGVRRDYGRAAALYEEACREGKGDLAACRRLLDAIGEARGARSDRERLISLATAMCLDGGDTEACVLSMFIWLGRSAPSTPQARAIERKLEELDVEHIDERCAAGEVRACEGFLAMSGMFFGGDGSSAEEERDAARAVLCKDGQLARCGDLIDDVTACAGAPDPEACVERVVDDWTQYEARDLLDALARVRRGCDAGDARACAVLPGRAIPREELCAARDYGACAELGCRGDADAARLGADNGARVRCDEVDVDDEDDEPAPPRPVPPRLVAEPPVPPFTPTDRLPFDSLRFRQLAIRDESGWPRFEVHNLGKRRVTGAVVVFYAFDAAGNQLARSWPTGGGFGKLDPGASARLDVSDRGYRPTDQAGVTYEVCYESISFARDSTTYRTRCPARKKRGERWGDGRSRTVLTVAALMPRGGAVTLADDEHAYDERHVAAFEAAHPDLMIELVPRWYGVSRGHGSRPDVQSSEQREAAPRTVQVPVTVTPVAIVYRLDGVDRLQLSAATLGKIFRGEVTRWDDRAIARENPGTPLPAVAITVRRHPSGLPDALARYLGEGGAPRATGAAWLPLARALEVEETNGAISHLDLALARVRKLKVARLKNRAGVHVEPSAAGATAAAASVPIGADLGFDPVDAPAADAYPIVYVTYAVVSPPTTDTPTWKMIVPWLTYLLTDAQATLAQDHVGALPPALAARAVAAVQALPPPPPAQ